MCFQKEFEIVNTLKQNESNRGCGADGGGCDCGYDGVGGDSGGGDGGGGGPY